MFDPIANHLADAIDEANEAYQAHHDGTGTYGSTQELGDASRMFLEHHGIGWLPDDEAIALARTIRAEDEEIQMRRPIDVAWRRAG